MWEDIVFCLPCLWCNLSVEPWGCFSKHLTGCARTELPMNLSHKAEKLLPVLESLEIKEVLRLLELLGRTKFCQFFVVAQFSEFVKCFFLVKKLRTLSNREHLSNVQFVDFPSTLGNFSGKWNRFPHGLVTGRTVQGTPMQTLWCDSSMVL